MIDETKDYPEEDAEEVVLSRWGKIKQWIEIAMATKKVAMLIWSLVIATGGSVVVGQVTDTRPLRDAAVAVGFLEEIPKDILGNNAMYGELSNLIEDVERLDAEVAQLQEEMTQHGHPLAAGVAGVAGVAGPPGPRGPQGIAGVAGIAGLPGKDGAVSVAELRDEIEKLLPENHTSLH
jgi:hypothetical protein